MTDENDLTQLSEAQRGLAHMAVMLFGPTLRAHPEIRSRTHHINLVLAEDARVNEIIRRVWRTVAEVALIGQLIDSDKTTRAELKRTHRTMQKKVDEMIALIIAYAEAHPEAHIDLAEFTRDWSLLRGTTPDIQLHIPSTIKRSISPFEQLLGRISWWPR